MCKAQYGYGGRGMGEEDSNFHIQTSVFLGQEEDDCVLSGCSYLSAAVLQYNYGSGRDGVLLSI